MAMETNGSASRRCGVRQLGGRWSRAGATAVLAVLLSAGSVEAASWHVGARVGAFEATESSDTWDAIYGETMIQYGLQVEARFRSGLFLALAVDRGSVDGELVAPRLGGGTVPTGTPTELTMTPIHFTVGGIAWRDRVWQLYYGGGLTQLDWEDVNAVDPIDSSDGGLHALVGVRRGLGRRVEVAGEARWSSVPDAIGTGGASALFGEDNLGGISAHLVVSFQIGR